MLSLSATGWSTLCNWVAAETTSNKLRRSPQSGRRRNWTKLNWFSSVAYVTSSLAIRRPLATADVAAYIQIVVITGRNRVFVWSMLYLDQVLFRSCQFTDVRSVQSGIAHHRFALRGPTYWWYNDWCWPSPALRALIICTLRLRVFVLYQQSNHGPRSARCVARWTARRATADRRNRLGGLGQIAPGPVAPRWSPARRCRPGFDLLFFSPPTSRLPTMPAAAATMPPHVARVYVGRVAWVVSAWTTSLYVPTRGASSRTVISDCKLGCSLRYTWIISCSTSRLHDPSLHCIRRVPSLIYHVEIKSIGDRFSSLSAPLSSI